MSTLRDDYFAAEKAISDKLQELVGAEVRGIYTPFSVADVLKIQETPALHILYAGDTLSSGDTSAARTENADRRLFKQRWMVVVAVRTAQAQLKETAETRKLAGPLVSKIILGLAGFKPAQGMRELVRVGGPAPGYTATAAYYPILYEAQVIL